MIDPITSIVARMNDLRAFLSKGTDPKATHYAVMADGRDVCACCVHQNEQRIIANTSEAVPFGEWAFDTWRNNCDEQFLCCDECGQYIPADYSIY